MNHAYLHGIKDFAALFDDQRLRAAIVHLRANFPNKEAASGDEWRGYFRAFEELEKLSTPPTSPPPKTEPTAPYTKATPAKPPESK